MKTNEQTLLSVAAGTLREYMKVLVPIDAAVVSDLADSLTAMSKLGAVAGDEWLKELDHLVAGVRQYIPINYQQGFAALGKLNVYARSRLLPAASEAAVDLFREALAWGMVYGPKLVEHQWEKLRDEQAVNFAGRLDASEAGAVPVAEIRHYEYSGIARNGFSQEPVMLDGAPVLPAGTKLFTSPPAPVEAGAVRDALDWVDDFIASCNGNDRGACESVNVLRRALAAPSNAPAQQDKQDDIGPHDLRTSKGGRGYIAEYFRKRLKRHDFDRYISDTLAADFACVLAQYLSDSAQPAPAAQGDALGAQVRLMQWHGGAGLLWDMYAFGKWSKRIVGPLDWDAHAVYLDMQRAGYAKHIELRLVSSSNSAKPEEPNAATPAREICGKPAAQGDERALEELARNAVGQGHSIDWTDPANLGITAVDRAWFKKGYRAALARQPSAPGECWRSGVAAAAEGDDDAH
jgi:hypothetical protein